MATLIFDIDGTIVKYHTNEWIEGALEYIEKMVNEGHNIVFITMRGPQDVNTEWSVERTKDTILTDLENKNIQYSILWHQPTPRIIYDDADVYAHKRVRNQKWK